MPSGIINRSYYDAAEKGRQDATNAAHNALANQSAYQQVQQGQRVNALMQDPSATAEQFTRAGATGIGAGLTNINNGADERTRAQATQMMQFAQYGIQSQTPKAFVEQNAPDLAKAYGPDWATATDDQVRAGLQEAIGHYGPLAGVGPAPKAPVGPLVRTVGPDGKPVYSRAEDAVGKPAFYQEPNRAGSGNASEVMTPEEVADAGLPIGTVAQRAYNGKVSILSRPDAGPGSKPPTEGDKRARVMYRSMQNSEKQLETFTKSDTSDLGQAFLGKIPAGKVIQSQEYKQYEAAGLRWAANLLYLKSGATATPDEIRSTYLQFLPQPGDGLAVKAQKNEARTQELDAVNEAYSFEAPRSGNVPKPPSAAPGASSTGQRLTPEQASKLPPGTAFIGMDGQPRVRN